MGRVLRGMALFFELALFSLFGIAVAYGRFDLGIFVFIYVFGVIVALSIATTLSMPAWIMGKVITHGILVAGCVVFALPFFWLMSTSFKYKEEIFTYPPKWAPSVPRRILRSPYVTAELYEAIRRPRSVSKTRWARLWPKLEEIIWQKGRSFLDSDRTAGLQEASLRPALVHGLWVAASQGVASQVWQGPEEGILAAVEARINQERVDEVWDSIYRCVALRDITVKDVDLVERALSQRSQLQRWKPEGGEAVRCFRPASTGGPAGGQPLFITYNLERAQRVAVLAEMPLPIPSERFLGLTIPLRQDRSWHRLQFALEMDGKCYVPEDKFYLGHRGWQEITLKLKSRDPRDERDVGVWPLVAVERPGAFNKPGHLRLTLAVERTSRIGAIWHKYSDSYRSAYLATKRRWNYLFNSVYLVVLNVAGQVLSCSLVAYAFARLRWPGRDALFALLLATMMLPGQVTMIPVFIIFKNLHWYNTLKALWVPAFLGSPFFIFLLRQFMKTIPVELEDAAKIDGCSFLGVYWRIMLPLLKPALAAVGIFTFMGTWNNFMGPLIYLNDERLYPLALGLYDFSTQYGMSTEYGMLMAASTMMTLPVIAMFFLAQRYFIQGITLTGLKG